MIPHSRRRSPLLVLVLLCASSCALTNKADPLNLRYFAPFGPELENGADQPAAGTAEPTVVRIDRVDAAAHLTEAVAYRKSETEVAYYEDLRWTETPNVYLERAVGQALFGDGTLRRGLNAGTYSVEAVLEAFEELKYEQPRVRMVTRVWVANDSVVLRERRFSIEQAIAKDASRPAQAAVAVAFTRAIARTAELIRSEVHSVTAMAPPRPLADEVGVAATQEP
jgi:ABC-type uncharacterized transport system auxiliary subunit